MTELDEESLRKLRKELGKEQGDLTSPDSAKNGEAALTREELKTLKKELGERQTPYKVPYWESDFGLTEEELRGIRQYLGIKEEAFDPFAKTRERKTSPIPEKPIQEISVNDEMLRKYSPIQPIPPIPSIPPIPPIPSIPPIRRKIRGLEELIEDNFLDSMIKQDIGKIYEILEEKYSKENIIKNKINKYIKYNDSDFFKKKEK